MTLCRLLVLIPIFHRDDGSAESSEGRTDNVPPYHRVLLNHCQTQGAVQHPRVSGVEMTTLGWMIHRFIPCFEDQSLQTWPPARGLKGRSKDSFCIITSSYFVVVHVERTILCTYSCIRVSPQPHSTKVPGIHPNWELTFGKRVLFFCLEYIHNKLEEWAC